MSTTYATITEHAAYTETDPGPGTTESGFQGKSLGRPSDPAADAYDSRLFDAISAATRGERRLGAASRWGRALAVHFISMVLSIVAFALVFSFLALGVGTVIIWIGLPILALTLFLSRGYARAKKRLALWQGARDWEELPPAPARKGVLARMWRVLGNPERWRELAYATVGALIDFVLAVVAVAVLGFGLEQIVAPFLPWVNGLVGSLVFEGVISHSFLPGFTGVWDIGIGMVSLGLGIPLVWGLSVVQIGLTRLFLAPSRAAIARRLHEAEQAKVATEQAETTNLVRIERDLHDGPQQRLIRTGLDLASLERRLEEGDTDGARALLGEVRSRNDETLAEIRTLSRGFAPPILAEAGLKQAIASLAATSPIPTSVSTELAGPRPPEAVERAVYFAVSEALANAAKHSDANAILVDVRQSPYGIIAQIIDNGRGGAKVLPGHGLQGLSDRLVGVGGQISVGSEPGHGTTVRVEIAYS